MSEPQSHIPLVTIEVESNSNDPKEEKSSIKRDEEEIHSGHSSSSIDSTMESHGDNSTRIEMSNGPGS